MIFEVVSKNKELWRLVGDAASGGLGGLWTVFFAESDEVTSQSIAAERVLSSWQVRQILVLACNFGLGTHPALPGRPRPPRPPGTVIAGISR